MKNLIMFESAQIRRIWDDESEEWYFVVVDVIQALTQSKDSSAYWRQLKRREPELVTNCHKFPMKNPKNNRTYQTDCANTRGMLRIIQSIPSPKAEPFKQWLAQVGYERTQEIADPSLAWERARELYKQKGYDDKWIDARLQTKEGRKQLTDEWEQRGIEKGVEYAILTNEIHKGTFDLTTKQHKDVKGLKRENLRDYMSPIELALTTLGEVTTTDMARLNDAQGFEENKKAAQAGGEVAGGARKAYELQTGKKAVSGKYLPGKEDAAALEEGDSAEPDSDA